VILAVLLAAVQHCTFAGPPGHLMGSCGQIGDQIPKMTLASRVGELGGVWRKDATPRDVWAGEMTDAGYPDAPIELEAYGDGSAMLRAVYGWFPVTNLAVSPSNLTFDVDTSRDVPPNDVDRAIVVRAQTILSSPAVWNRADNRKCPDGASSWSIYCAMIDATKDTTGGSDHRRPAMEVVRELIETRSAGRSYDHRLMDYNNDPRTTFAEVTSAFREALQRMDDAAWLAAHGFAPAP
jgi:hypothetical protein